MIDRTTEPLLGICVETGALALYDLWREVLHLAGNKEFTSAEIVAHAALPKNARLKAALTEICGTDVRRIGKTFAKWESVSLGGIVITAIGNESNVVLWRVECARSNGNESRNLPRPADARVSRH